MNPAHPHLLTTHVPVMGTNFGLCLLLFALLRGSEELKRVALPVFVVAALVGLPAYLSGSSASNLLKRVMPGMTMDAGDQHAEIAILALVGSLALGVAALVGLVLFRNGRSLPVGYLVFVLLLAMVACGLLGWTANLDMKIRHLELRSQTSAGPGWISAKVGASQEMNTFSCRRTTLPHPNTAAPCWACNRAGCTDRRFPNRLRSRRFSNPRPHLFARRHNRRCHHPESRRRNQIFA